jgi:acyl-CoA synthetase (AMP-forming)/AMP-acid ligase II
MKIGGEGYKWRIRNGVLQIKSNSAMLGYINAPAPFTDDGWFITGDLVEQDGEYLKILGRKSDLINVGGEKVYPGEVEDAILRLPWVKQVSVYGEKNPLMGNIVCALVKTVDDLEDYQKAKQDIKRYCQDRLEKHKVPIRINFSDKELHSTRFKLMRPS